MAEDDKLKIDSMMVMISVSKTDTGAEGMTEGEKQNRNKDKEVNVTVENMVEDRIMDSGASFHATYCKEELERFKLRSGKVCLADDKTLDIAGVRDVVLKTSFGTSWTLKDVRWFGEVEESFLYNVSEDKETAETATGVAFGVAERLSQTFKAESMRIQSREHEDSCRGSKDVIGRFMKDVCGEAMKCTFIGSGSDEMRYSFWDTKSHQSPSGSSDTSEGSESSGSFEDSGRSDEEYSEDGASSKEGGSEAPYVRRSTKEFRAPVMYSSSANYLLLAENGEPVLFRSLELPAGKKASQRLWMFKVKEDHNISEK
ncbi:hypothetical protein Tco_0911876, partial [Tanacetum coccineum]